jgi:catechol 2,3-dioxygenase-like lactoylglutathione lyase family enzyme
MIKLEHANLSVSDIDATTRFVTAAFPEFVIRGEGLDSAGRPWRHVGTDDFYVALQAVEINPHREPYGNDVGLNHLGWEVEDVAAVEARLRQAGFEPNLHADAHPARRRVYFYDPDGNDWEFVQYLTDDPAERNDYERI